MHFLFPPRQVAFREFTPSKISWLFSEDWAVTNKSIFLIRICIAQWSFCSLLPAKDRELRLPACSDMSAGAELCAFLSNPHWYWLKGVSLQSPENPGWAASMPTYYAFLAAQRELSSQGPASRWALCCQFPFRSSPRVVTRVAWSRLAIVTLTGPQI